MTTSVRVGLRDELVEWAAAQPTAEGRAAAWVLIAQALSAATRAYLMPYPAW